MDMRYYVGQVTMEPAYVKAIIFHNNNNNMATENGLYNTSSTIHNADNLATFMCQLSGNSGSLNLLQPQRPVQACIRIVLPFNYP